MALEKTASFLSVFALVCGQAAPHGSDTPPFSQDFPSSFHSDLALRLPSHHIITASPVFSRSFSESLYFY